MQGKQRRGGPAPAAHTATAQRSTGGLLSADEVHRLFGVDRSTIYRMAGDGRLAAVKIGRQWRFPADQIAQMLQAAPDPTTAPSDVVAQFPGGPADEDTRLAQLASPMLDVVADLLGVMMLVTNMAGRPLTAVMNPAPWFTEVHEDPSIASECVREWHDLAVDADLAVRFHSGNLGFECARAFIRSGPVLVGMVLAGGVSPRGSDTPGLHRLDDAERERVLTALPKIAAALSRALRQALDDGQSGDGTGPAQPIRPLTLLTTHVTDRSDTATNARSAQ